MVVAPVVLPIFTVSANEPFAILIVLSPWVPILIFWSSSSFPILIAPPDELSSIVLDESNSTVVAPLNVVPPLLSNAKVAVPSEIELIVVPPLIETAPGILTVELLDPITIVLFVSVPIFILPTVLSIFKELLSSVSNAIFASTNEPLLFAKIFNPVLSVKEESFPTTIGLFVLSKVTELPVTQTWNVELVGSDPAGVVEVPNTWIASWNFVCSV